MTGRRHLIAVCGPVGAGKSTLVSGLAARLVDAAIVRFDHYERVTDEPIEKIAQWMQDGADLDQIEIPGLDADLLSLKEGRPVVDPMTGAEILPGKYILFETQFGRRHSATARHIDFLVWIDTPLDVALARKLRQFAAEPGASDPGAVRAFAPWLHEYLDNYLAVVGRLLRIQRDSVGADADLAVDGMRAPDAQLREVERMVRERFG